MQPGTINVVEPGYVPGLELGCAQDQMTMMSKVDRQMQRGATDGSDYGSSGRMLRKELGTQTGMWLLLCVIVNINHCV